MSNLFGGTKATSGQPTELFGLQIQTSIYGSVVPYPYGTVRGSANVIWNGDWKANPVANGGKGSKGSSGGKYGNGKQYTYQTAIAMALGMGTISSILRVWQDRTQLSIQSSSEQFTIPGGGTVTPDFASTAVADVGARINQSYSHTVTDYGAPGAITLAGTDLLPLTRVTGTPGPGQYKVVSGVYHFNAAQIGATVTVQYYFYQSTPSIDGAPALTLNLTLFTGVIGQTPWSYLTTNHPTQALGFSEVAYVANQLMNLGSSGSVSNFAYEFQGNLIYPGQQDCLPTDIIADLLSNPNHIGMDPSLFSIPAEVSNYCLANNIFSSVIMSSQQPATQWLENLCKVSNCAPILSDGIFKLRSYGDTSAYANGTLFTPPTQPIVDLTDDDFIPQDEFGPVQVERPSVRQAYNSVIVEWTNRGNAYNTETVEAKDQLAIDTYGYRPAPTYTLPEISSQQVAQLVASVLLKFQVYKRQKYTFKLPIRFLYLEPMDIVTITDDYLGAEQQPVRITSVSEDEGKVLTIECEDFPWSMGAPTLYQRAQVGAIAPGYYAPPGSVYVPQFVDLTADPLFMPQTLGIALTGGPNYGGSQVYVSRDGGVSYQLYGSAFGNATMGALTSILHYAVDPDLTGTLAINISQSQNQLVSQTAENWDAFDSLIAVDRELLSYETVALTSSGHYSLTNLHRGVYGSQITRHEIGAQFCTVDENLFNFQYLAADVGTTLYFKFCSFNKAGQQLQNLAAVTAYAFTILAGLGRAPMPWYPNAEASNQMNLTQDADGVTLDINGYPISNVASPNLSPPAIDHNAVTAAGSGLIPIGEYVGCVVAYDASGLPSDISNLTNISISVFGEVATVNVTWSANAVSYRLFIGEDFNSMLSDINGVVSGTPAMLTFDSIGAGIPGANFRPVDVAASLYHIRAKRIIHGGPFDDNVLSIPTPDLVQLGQSLLTPSSLIGRTLSIISRYGLPATQNLQSDPIVDNTADTIQLGPFAALSYDPGDLIIINFLADSFSATTIGDSLASNGYFPGGWTDDLKNLIVRITSGTGAGQWRYIKSHTTTVLTVSQQWDVVPDATSSFIIEEPTWRVDTTTLPFQNLVPPGAPIAKIGSINLADLAGYLALVEVLPQSASGLDAIETYVEFRQLYIQPTDNGPVGISINDVTVVY